MKAYSKEIIEHFTSYVRDGEDSFLKDNGYLELMAVLDAIRGDDNALQFLIRAKQFELAGFADAVVNENKSAFQMLINKKCTEWAATAGIIHGDEKAISFLNSKGLGHFVQLAMAMREIIDDDKRNKRGIFGL